jgi:hypothetical protein
MTSRKARIAMLARMIEHRRTDLEGSSVNTPILASMDVPRPEDAERLFMDGLASWHARRGLRGFPKHLLNDSDRYAYEQAKAEIDTTFENAPAHRPRRQLGFRNFSEYETWLGGQRGDGDDGISAAERLDRFVNKAVINLNRRDEETDVEYTWGSDEQAIGEEDRWREYTERVDREQGRASRMMDDAMRMTLFEEHLQNVLDADDYETWVYRREQPLKALAVMRGVSEQAIFYREQPIVLLARIEWETLNPGIPYPPLLTRRRRHDAPAPTRKIAHLK